MKKVFLLGIMLFFCVINAGAFIPFSEACWEEADADTMVVIQLEFGQYGNVLSYEEEFNVWAESYERCKEYENG